MMTNLSIMGGSKLFIAVMLTIFTFFIDLAPLALAVAIAIAMDTIFGVTAAIKMRDKVTSRKLGQAALKMFIYQTVLLGVFCIDKFIIGELMSRFFEIENIATKISALVLLYIELVSINENIFKITKINLFERFKSMMSASRDTLDDVDKINKL